jgi:23S rRNA pseudouridine2605 synthase
MERLQKVIAKAGIASRRKSETLIQEGKVTVNGQTVTELGTKVGPNDRIEVNGIPVEGEEPVYFLFYKPTGVISAASDDKGRAVVTDYFPMIKERIFPVGRLDYNTSGAILLTNDGEFANLMMHPKHKIEKVYIAKVKGTPAKETIRKIEKGVQLEDGKTAPAKVKVLSADRAKNVAILELTIHEGRNRQVRRMLEAVGHPVEKLKRERYSFLELKGLTTGEFRPLTPKEVKQLRALAVT